MSTIKRSGASLRARRIVVGIACALCSCALVTPARATQVGINPDITWGVSQADVNREISLSAQAGVTWVRAVVDMGSAEYAGPGRLGLSYLSSIDYAVSAARRAGLNVLMTFMGTPYWASADPTKTVTRWNPYWRYNNPQDFAAIASALVNRYKAMGVHAYEVWNEPNNQAFWPSGVNPAEYTALLKAAYPAIKASDRSATVVMGGLMGSSGSYDFLQGMYNAGARGSYDVADVHIYPGDPAQCTHDSTGRPSMHSFCLIDGMRSEMSANGDHVPVWLTELGWPTCSGTSCFSLQQQASYLTAAIQLLNSSNYSYVQNAFVYQLRDMPASTSVLDSMGVLYGNFTPKPAYAALASIAHLTRAWNGSTPTVQITAPRSGATVTRSTAVTVKASDRAGISKVILAIDGLPRATLTAPPYTTTLATKGLKVGLHTLTATAYDPVATATSSVILRKVSTKRGAQTSTRRRTSISLRLGSPNPLQHRAKVMVRVSGYSAARLFLVVARKAKARWVPVARRKGRAACVGNYAGILHLGRGVWRVTAVCGATRSAPRVVRA